MKMPSTRTHRFDQTPAIKLERSVFNHSHGHKTTFDSGYLIPILVKEVLPGDTWNVRASYFARLSTPLKPILDNMYLDDQYWFVPYRQLWSNWEKFNGAQDNPGDSTAFVVPTVPIPAGGPTVGTLFDYFGLPSGAQITSGYNVAAFASRAYNRIYNQWYKSQDLQNNVTIDTGDGPDTYANYVLKRRGKRHDYFTSALPFAQKGTAVTIPAGASSAPVTFVPYATSANNMLLRKNLAGDALTTAATTTYLSTMAGNPQGALSESNTSGLVILDPNGRLIADLSSAFATTINALRLAQQTQVLLERDARGGTRYWEILQSHFRVSNPQNLVLQRPEYLGGGSAPVNMTPVPMTAMASGGTAAGQQGNLAAYGTSASQGHGFNKSFTEHGLIMGLISVRADLTYQQGIDRMWSRSTRYDFYWPELAHIGEQSILNKEIYAQGTAADNLVFGYIPRFEEYRFSKSIVSGKFHSDYATPLDVWHLSQRFTSLPTLGDTFISETPPVSRIVAVTTEPQFFLDSYFNIKVARPMPVNGTPTSGDRF